MESIDLETLSLLDPTARAIVIAKDQPEYLPLPALVFPDGRVMTEWKLSEDERGRLIAGEHLRLWIWMFGNPLQPIALEVTSEDRS